MMIRNGSPSGTVLLINPSLFLEAAYGKVGRLMRPVPYINLAYLAASLESAGVAVHVHDDSVRHLTQDLLTRLVRDTAPDLIGISCLTPHATRVSELSGKIRDISPETPIVLGNLHADYFARELIEKGTADVVVRGEADETIVELFRAITTKSDLSLIAGICFKPNAAVIETPERCLLQDLDILPFPAWHLFPYKEYYFTPLSTIKRPLLPLLGSRGCPYRCTFCVNRAFQRTYRTRSPRRMVDEVRYLVERFGARQISLFDSSFPLRKRHGLAFCEAMMETGLNRQAVWTSMTRPDLIDENLLRAMRRAGCRRISYGMESGDDHLLQESGKGFRVADIERAALLTRRAGIESCGYFMLGLPGENEQTCQKTVRLAMRLPLDFVNFNLVVPYPGTDIYEQLKQQGRVQEIRWEKYATFNPDPDELAYLPAGLNPQWVVHLQKQALFRFYFRPRIILRHLFKIRTIPLVDMLRGLMLWLSFHLASGRQR